MKCWSLLLLSVFSVQAQVYQCETNGVVEFSQFPCATESEVVDMRPVGTAQAGSPAEFRQQVDALKRRSRFVEFQISRLESEKQQQVEELKSVQYQMRRNFPRAEELAAIAQRIERLEQQFDDKISTERANLRGLQAQVVNLERQFAQATKN